MDDSDNISNASFEQIGPKRTSDFEDFGDFGFGEEKHMAKLKPLVVKSAAHGAAKELAEGEVPDVCYILQYESLSGKVSDVCRSTEPIDISLHHGLDEGNLGLGVKKPILEIVTAISTRVEDDSSDVKISNVEKTDMIINSTHLINALKGIVGYYPGVSFIGDKVKIDAPYHVLVHNRAALTRFRVFQPETHDEDYKVTTAEHIDVLLRFLEKTLGKEMREEEERHQAATPKATFDKLWMLYKPGDVIYAKHMGRWTPFVVSRCNDGVPTSRGEDHSPYNIECWNINYSAGKFIRYMYAFRVDPFSGEEAIVSLPVVPARFFKGETGEESPETVAERNIKMGKKAWDLSKNPTYMAYDGSLVDGDCVLNNDWNSPTATTGYMSGRVIIDCQGYAKFSQVCPGDLGRHPRRIPAPAPARLPPPKDQLPYFAARCGCFACSKAAGDGEELSQFAKFEDLDPVSDEEPKHEIYYLVLSNIVSGFILGERRWGRFNVESLAEIKFDKEAFKYLVLDDEIKYTVKSLIGKFASASGKVSPWPKDFVKNKGQGRIFLLHGAPGVGKTVTVESMAEYCHRPLLSLTSGDLTTHDFTVERNLESFLQLGERFGAMVLLDEADVYLETRRANDIARNGLVSIFLRALEYYRGVLFLTTNRIHSFDSAFASRIHVALHYKNLTDNDREKIWLNSFERLERDSDGKVYISVATREYAYESEDVRSLRWNGREIRNALQTAVALAETDALEDGQDKVTVTDQHLRSVVKMSRSFKSFLRQRPREEDDVIYD